MSIGKVEKDIRKIKEEFSAISPGRATRGELVQEKKVLIRSLSWLRL